MIVELLKPGAATQAIRIEVPACCSRGEQKMALPSFDPVRKSDPVPPEDDWTQMRARLSVARNNSRKREAGVHSGRFLLAAIVGVVAALAIVGLASRERARLRGLFDSLWQVAQDYTNSQPAREQASRKTPRSSKERSAKTRVTQKPALSPVVPSPGAASKAASSQMGQFAEVVDTRNRHYLVRYRQSPVVPLPGEQLPPSSDAQAGESAVFLPRAAVEPSPGPVTNINLRAYAPGSAGVVVLQGLVGGDGRVSDVKILSGPPELAQAAAEAARRWHYVPEYYNGRPRERLVQITVDFTVLLTE